MDTPEHLAAQEVPTKFRVGDLIRVNTQDYVRWGVNQYSEHRVLGLEAGTVVVDGKGVAGLNIVYLAPRDCSFVQRAPARSHAAHHEDEIIGGGHSDWVFPMGTEEAEREFVKSWEATPQDMVNLPDHYARFPIEPIRFVVENAAAFKDPRVAAIMAHVIPYLLRHEFKGGVQDLEKAVRLLHMLIKFEQGDPDWWKADREQPREPRRAA